MTAPSPAAQCPSHQATIIALALLGAFGTADAQIPAPIDDSTFADAYRGTADFPYAGRSFPSPALWGDTLLHTVLSMDAGAFGNRLGLDAAYRFALGESRSA
ncbi:MAG: DUF3604 domain-containing protein [Thiohalocapsa sp.]